MMWAVSGPGDGNGRGEEPAEAAGVLANLPRTRPHRDTGRRDAARRRAAAEEELATGNGSGNGNGSAPRKAAAAKPAKSAGPRSGPGTTGRGAGTRAGAAKAKPRPKAAKTRRRETEDVPRQGYESVEDRATGPVQPPGGTEFVGTAAEIVSELAKAGISSGERVLRDVLSRLGR
jgi:hypothetical protein